MGPVFIETTTKQAFSGLSVRQVRTDRPTDKGAVVPAAVGGEHFHLLHKTISFLPNFLWGLSVCGVGLFVVLCVCCLWGLVWLFVCGAVFYLFESAAPGLSPPADELLGTQTGVWHKQRCPQHSRDRGLAGSPHTGHSHSPARSFSRPQTTFCAPGRQRRDTHTRTGAVGDPAG